MPISTNNICDLATQVSNYSCVTYLDDVQLSDGLLSGTIKNAAVVACSDMGISGMGACVPFVCSDPNAQLFMFQNFGHHFETGGMVETIAENGIERVVVYGHSGCEYTKFLAKSQKVLSSEDANQLCLYAAAVESDREADWKIVGQYNVLNKLKRMFADPVISKLVEYGRLQMHGWFFNSATKQIEVFDPKQKAFITVAM